MRKIGIVILAHGSRGEKGMGEVVDSLGRLTRGVRAFLPDDVEVVGAALQFNHPDMNEAIDFLLSRGTDRVVIVPYFLFSGRHITEHIPEIIGGLKSVHPDKEFILADNLGLDEYFIDLMAQRILEAAPELALDGDEAPASPSGIERLSMTIIDKILPPMSFSEEERTVVKRLVHTSGDRHIASLVRFHPGAITAAISAIRRGKPVFTDVRMVAVAINRRMTANFGCPVYCGLEELESAQSELEKESTRAAAAFKLLGKRLEGSIAVIGNAPTALHALLDLNRREKVTPALVIGMPVGFVQAKESKEALMKTDIPHISIAGTRGGSALAAATVNALLKMA